MRDLCICNNTRKDNVMKNIFYLTFLLLLVVNGFSAAAATPALKKSGTIRSETKKSKLTESEVIRLVARVDEIKKMDIKNLPAKEKRELRKEVRNIQKKLDMNADGFSIYIGGGALIVIIVLLILLL